MADNRKMKRKLLGIQNIQSTTNPKEAGSYIKYFCEATSLHGWAFFGKTAYEKKASFLSIFWIAVIGFSVGAAVFVMGTTIRGEIQCK
jgi:hypothetical protein